MSFALMVMVVEFSLNLYFSLKKYIISSLFFYVVASSSSGNIILY